MDYDNNNPIEKFAVSTTYITLKNHHTWVCPVYFLDSLLQGNKYELPKLGPRLRAGVYIEHSPFHIGSVALVLNPEIGNVSPQYHVVFDDEFSTVQLFRTDTITINWIDPVQRRSQSGAP